MGEKCLLLCMCVFYTYIDPLNHCQLNPCPIPTLGVQWDGFNLGSGRKENCGLCQLMPHLRAAAVASLRLHEDVGGGYGRRMSQPF